MALLRGCVDGEEPGRLDRYVADVLKAVSRSQFKARFVKAEVNGRDAKPSRLLKAGDSFLVELRDEEDRSGASAPEDIPLSVLYEDDEVIVLDKPQGMVVHPAHGNWSGTLANALLWRLGAGRRAPTGASDDEVAATAPPRAGLVHRLDKDTSGVIIAGKTAASQEYLAAQFRARTTVKTYLPITRRAPRSDAGRVEGWLARDPKDRKRFAPSPEGTGKRALSEWRVLARAGGYGFLALGLRTGRTHQLRVHCKALGCPIVGDPIYGERDDRFPWATLMLHAYELTIRLPGSVGERRFRAPVPSRFRALAEALAPGASPWESLES